ncbi:MAG: hypothetical protein JWQ11_3058 [Rhizobacter sp.]|nr:hypothetical protein [Rhizobacter sp.]
MKIAVHERLEEESSSFHHSGPAEQILPFTVRTVRSERHMKDIQALRAKAYGHHLPGLKESFGQSDPLDLHPDVTVFYAEDKVTGEVIGSVRIQTNRTGPLQIERSLALPEEFNGKLLAEITRLTVLPGQPLKVRMALMKALQMYCVTIQVACVLAGSRHSLLRVYQNLGFSDIYADERQVPLLHAGNLGHRVLKCFVASGERRLLEMNNRPVYDFVFGAYHPDIMLFDTAPRLTLVSSAPVQSASDKRENAA